VVHGSSISVFICDLCVRWLCDACVWLLLAGITSYFRVSRCSVAVECAAPVNVSDEVSTYHPWDKIKSCGSFRATGKGLC
jgi:hypothetical protein